MFTGIIETLGEITKMESSGTNKSFWIRSTISSQLKPDQSVSHDGVCLTVEEVADDLHKVTAIAETLHVSTLNEWQAGKIVNLERCMLMNGRLDGHIVQGHVDATAKCISLLDKKGSTEYVFDTASKYSNLLIEKGSVSVNGISLTVFNVTNSKFSVAIIPYTMQHTSIKHINAGDEVNIEFDVIGKYVNRILSLK